MNGKYYSLVVIAPNIGEKHPDGRELGGGNTGAPIFRDIVTELLEWKINNEEWKIDEKTPLGVLKVINFSNDLGITSIILHF